MYLEPAVYSIQPGLRDLDLLKSGSMHPMCLWRIWSRDLGLGRKKRE